MAAGIQLQEQAFARVAIPPAAMPRRATAANRGNAGSAEDAAHARPRQVDALVLGEHLGEMVLVEAAIRRGRQFDHTSRDRLRHGVARSSPTVAVDHSSRPVAAQRGCQTSDLALAEVQELGCLTRRDQATGELQEHLYSTLL